MERVAAAIALLALAGCATLPPPAAPGLDVPPVQAAPPKAAAPEAAAAPPSAPEVAAPEVGAPEPEPIAMPPEPDEEPARPLLREIAQGVASWYGPRFHGRKTASGERFDQEAMTAAHRTLPFGTIVRVTSLVNGRTVDVRINDRGPHLKRRIIDLSRGAARALGLLEAGTGVKPVVLSIVEEAGGGDAGK